MIIFESRAVYRLLILSAFILIFGCQAPPDEDKNVVKTPEWINQKDFDEFPFEKYIVAVGVSEKSYDDARSRAFSEIAHELHSDCFWFEYPSEEFLNRITPYIPKEYDNYVDASDKRVPKRKDNDFHDLVYGYLLERTSDSISNVKYPSWAELFTVEQKKYSDGFIYYVLVTLDIDGVIKRKPKKLLRLFEESKTNTEIDLVAFLENFYSCIELLQIYHTKYLYLRTDTEYTDLDEDREEVKALLFEMLRGFQDKLVELYRDLEIRFSEDNVKGWRDKFTDKIDIQIFWKKNLIKVPMRFETSKDAQVELIASTKRDISYELRVMPRSESNRTNASGQHFVEFDLKPKDLRFSKLINFALKKKFHFTLPTKKNSYFQLVVNPEVLDNASVTKRQFADNLCSELNNSLALWCKNKKYMVSDPTQTRAQTQQTQTSQNRYDFKVVVDFVDSDINETRGKKILTVDLDLKLLYFDDSLDTPAWVRLKQDSYKFSDVLITDSKIDDSSMFVLYCVGLFQDPDFEKVIADLFKRAHS